MPLTSKEDKDFEDFVKSLPPHIIDIVICAMAFSIWNYLRKHWRELKLDELVKKNDR